MRDLKFKTADGRCTPYALACGYVDQYENDGYRVRLWSESETYHVRLHDFGPPSDKGLAMVGHRAYNPGRIRWFTSESLTEARQMFDAMRRLVDASVACKINLEHGE